MSAMPWLVFMLFGAGIMAWSLKTERAWHWGALITKADNPFGYYQFLLGAGLPVAIILIALLFGWLS
ncbi:MULTISPECIES: hypothetical protein [unclassified Sphingomonas]|uniref:hypothetical protein n=1 Tax=unclassified Sphingomonas TaxID=196159 RepID=UPI0022B5B6AD|nr:hypothetical protein [Sphingomonas sp. NIBR02145]WHU02260.1 hypothetical protein O3305_19060 [Sphingomonas sp. NIBR02145]